MKYELLYDCTQPYYIVISSLLYCLSIRFDWTCFPRCSFLTARHIPIDRTFYPTSWWAYCARGAVGSSFKFQKSFCSTCLSRRTLHMDLISCECGVYMGDTHIVYLILKCIWHLSNRIHYYGWGCFIYIAFLYYKDIILNTKTFQGKFNYTIISYRPLNVTKGNTQ